MSKYSDFWFDNRRTTLIDDLLSDIDDKPVKKGKDHVALAGHKRAIGNFVRIVSGQNIPVKFPTRGDSYTDGKSVTIGANLTDKNFDVAVGLALHEGSHIKLSDFNFLKNLDTNIPAEIFVLSEKKGFDRQTTLGHVKSLLNYVEDRRID